MIAQYLPFLLSAVTIWMTLLAGNKHPKAWAVGLVNQALWLVWIVSTSAWGLLPMNIALWVVYGRNHLKWDASASPEAIDELIRIFQTASQSPKPIKPDQPDEKKAIPFGWREVIEQARDSIGGGSYSENRQHELSIVGPYLDGLADEFEHLQEVCEAVGQLGLDPVFGDVLPQVGDKVLIHLGRSERWVKHTVVGYYVWKDLGGSDSLHRVFVRVKSADGYLNARMLKDIRPIDWKQGKACPT